jgi:peroxiredoxin
VVSVYPTPGICDQEKAGKDLIEFAVDVDLIGKPMVDFEGMTTDGRKVSSEDLRGRVFLITLWGVNCGSCLDELKALETLYKDLKDREFEIWAVNTEQFNSDEIHKRLKRLEISVTFPLLTDEDMSITKIFTSWFIPVTVIVDRNGIVQYYKIGFNNSDGEEIRRVVGELLK